MIVFQASCRAEHGHRIAHVGERVEALDEFTHDAQDPPRIGARERSAPLDRNDLRRYEELFVFSKRAARRGARLL